MFDELARWAAAALGLPFEMILSALLKREELGSTGTGKGVAIPHARLSGIGKPFVLLARLNTAVEFDAVDGMPVDIVCLVLLPVGSEENQHVLACIARVLRDAAVLRNIRRAANHVEAYRALGVKGETQTGRYNNSTDLIERTAAVTSDALPTTALTRSR